MEIPEVEDIAAIDDPRQRAVAAHGAVKRLQGIVDLRDGLARLRNEAVAELFSIEERSERPVQRNVAHDLGVTVQRLQEMLARGREAERNRLAE